MRAKKTRETPGELKHRAAKVVGLLKSTYPDAHCSLTYSTPFQLLAATILSAQCTDARVNKVTPALFARFPDAQAMAKAKLSEVERLIQSTGFFKNKARSLVECSKALVEKHSGEVPETLADLVALRGVGRKTANVVLGNAFSIPGMVVDTHVGRLARRLGWVKSLDPERVEQELMQIIPESDWTLLAHLLIYHGRTRCMARRPNCAQCELGALCPRVGVQSIAVDQGA